MKWSRGMEVKTTKGCEESGECRKLEGEQRRVNGKPGAGKDHLNLRESPSGREGSEGSRGSGCKGESQRMFRLCGVKMPDLHKSVGFRGCYWALNELA